MFAEDYKTSLLHLQGNAMNTPEINNYDEPAVVVMGSLESLTEGDNANMAADDSANSGII